MGDLLASWKLLAERCAGEEWHADGEDHNVIIWRPGDNRVCFMTSDGKGPEDADDILAARAAIPLMVKEIERLRAREVVLTEAHSIASAINRSIWQVAERNGKQTNWDSLKSGIMRALETSHEAMNNLAAPQKATASTWIDPDDCEETP